MSEKFLINCRAAETQLGVAALPISILLLFVASIGLISVSRTSLMEQRLSANEIRERQAFQAAQAGIDNAYAYMRSPGGIDKNANNVADVFSETFNKAAYKVRYCEPDSSLTLQACPDAICPAVTAGNFKIPMILSCGVSDDGVAVRAIVSSVAGSPSLEPKNVSFPLISGGSVILSGSASVANYFDDRIILSAADYDAKSSAGKIYLRNPVVHEVPSTLPPAPTSQNIASNSNPDAPYYSLQTDEQDVMTIGKMDSIQPETIFESIFCMDLETYKNSLPLDRDPPLTASTLNGIKGEVVVLTGDQTISGGIIGTQEEPVILIIDGNLTMNGSPEIHGIVYADGNIQKGTGVATVYGALIAKNNLDFGAGNMTIVYDRFAVKNASGLGSPGILCGSWRDWL